VRRLDAALGLWSRDVAAQDSVPSAWREGGVEPPHSKALCAHFRGFWVPVGARA